MAFSFHKPNPEAMHRILEKNKNTREGAIIRLAWLQGLSREEIHDLQWTNISFDDHEIVLPDRRVPMCEDMEQFLAMRKPIYEWASPYVVISYRTRNAVALPYISHMTRAALDEEESLRDVRLTDLRHDFIIRQLETKDWAYVARISGFTVTSFQTLYSPYIKVRLMGQKELQGDDEYRIWQVLQKEKDTMEGLALSMRWFMNLGIGEMVNLTWDQVDFQNDCLHLPDRDVALTSLVRKSLLTVSQQRKEGEDSHVLLKNTARTPMDVSYLSKRVRTIMLRSGVDNIHFRDVCRESEKKSDKARLLELAKKKPGFSRSDALEALDITKHALYMRLRELLEEKKLVRVGMMYYLPGTVVMEEEQTAVVRAYLKEHSTATMADLRFLLRIERRQCGRTLKKMVESGEIIREGDLFRLPPET